MMNSAPSQVLLRWAGKGAACSPLVWGESAQDSQLLPPSLFFPQAKLFFFQFVKGKVSCYFYCSWTPTTTADQRDLFVSLVTFWKVVSVSVTMSTPAAFASVHELCASWC